MTFQKRTLFLGDLPIFCSELDLENLFLPFGDIYEIRLKVDKTTNRNLSYGFIKFVIPECAERALQTLDGYRLHGRAIKVRWASKSGNDDESSSKNTVQVHVSYVSRQTELIVNENSLRTLFSCYGDVLDVSIKQSSIIKENTETQSGYGFVHFANTPTGVRGALSAVVAFHNVTVDDVTYDCHLSHRCSELPLADIHAVSDTQPEQQQLPSASSSHPLKRAESMVVSDSGDSMNEESVVVTSEADGVAGTGALNTVSPPIPYNPQRPAPINVMNLPTSIQYHNNSQYGYNGQQQQHYVTSNTGSEGGGSPPSYLPRTHSFHPGSYALSPTAEYSSVQPPQHIGGMVFYGAGNLPAMPATSPAPLVYNSGAEQQYLMSPSYSCPPSPGPAYFVSPSPSPRITHTLSQQQMMQQTLQQPLQQHYHQQPQQQELMVNVGSSELLSPLSVEQYQQLQFMQEYVRQQLISSGQYLPASNQQPQQQHYVAPPTSQLPQQHYSPLQQQQQPQYLSSPTSSVSSMGTPNFYSQEQQQQTLHYQPQPQPQLYRTVLPQEQRRQPAYGQQAYGQQQPYQRKQPLHGQQQPNNPHHANQYVHPSVHQARQHLRQQQF